jgi:hypothetical protein
MQMALLTVCHRGVRVKLSPSHAHASPSKRALIHCYDECTKAIDRRGTEEPSKTTK